MKRLLLILSLSFSSLLQAQSLHQVVLDYFLANDFNDLTYRRQCSCHSSFDSTYKILVVDSTDFKPVLENFASYLNVDGAEIAEFDYINFKKSYIELDSTQQYKLIPKAPSKSKRKHIIRFSTVFEKDEIAVIEIWVKDNLNCPGIIYAYLIDTEKKKVLLQERVRVCDSEG